jgi:tetratricopeptide (TPR) repeat protein
LHFAIRNLQFLSVVAAVLSLSADLALAQDDVVHRRNGIVDRGKIISQDATGIRMIRSDNRKEILIPADLIDRVDVKLTKEQMDGDALFEQKQFQGAAEKFEQALKVETRGWLRGRIASNLVACHVAAGDPVGAIEAFFAASPAAEGQISLGAVPIWWLPEPPGGKAVQYAATLLRSTDPLQQVIGASFLYGTDQSTAARDTLAKLTTYRDERVGQLARAQLWRWDAATAKPDDVATWQRQVTRLPSDARGGPYFVIGLAFQDRGAHEEAALAFLWPALVYRTDPKLSRRAALLAAQSLEQAGQAAEAKQLYAEVAAQFAPSTEATAAQLRLDALKE